MKPTAAHKVPPLGAARTAGAILPSLPAVRIDMFLRLMPVLILLATTAPLQAAQPVYRAFQDWVVACDNLAHCQMQAATDHNSLFLTLRREAGPTGALELRLEAGREIRPGALRLDGQPLRLDASGWQHSRGDGYAELVTDDPVTARAFLQAIRNGDRLHVGEDEQAPVLSLAGISAALLLLDEAQGRLDNVTALLRTGNEPASAVPPAAAPPRLHPAPPSPPAIEPALAKRLVAAARHHHADQLDARECLVEPEAAFDTVVPLGQQEALVMLECWRGAYQASFLLFRTPLQAPEHSRRISLPLPLALGEPGRERDRVDEFVHAGYDPVRGVLSHFAKGRGLADCGRSASWVFDGDDFQLQSLHYLGRCSGGHPGDWPRLWVTQDTPREP